MALPDVRRRAVAGAERETGDEELALVLLEGACTISGDGFAFELGPRAGVFEQLPWTVYLPRDTSYRIEGDAELAIASAPVERGSSRSPASEEVDVEVRGAATRRGRSTT